MKMKFIIILPCLLNIISDIQCSQLDNDIKEFVSWKVKNQKLYKNAKDEQKGIRNFLKNKLDIDHHNEKFESGKETFSRGLWDRSDLSTEEINNLMNGWKAPGPYKKSRSISDDVPENFDAPPFVNWTAQGLVSTVRDQGLCGSCWSFSCTGAIEGQIFKKTRNLTKLSEQNLIDCNKNTITGNWGCDGGSQEIAYEYIKGTRGISSAAKYPYKAKDNLLCTYNSTYSVGTVTSYTHIPSKNETLLKNAVAAIGPISIAIDASLSSFQSYKSGVYNDAACSNSTLNHGMLIVGYGTDPVGGDYWLIKNTYGLSWGERGYIKLARNRDNMCGVTNYAMYVSV